MKQKSLEDQIIDQRMNELKQTQPSGLLTDKEQAVYAALAADFPKEAMTADKSRGFALTSIKAQYVTERLNDVIGFMNWTHGGEFQLVNDGVLFLGSLIITVDGRKNQQFSPGFAKITPNKNLGDAYKSAKTDSLSKAASLIGVGNAVFKGQVDATTLENTSVATAVAPTTARAKKAAEAFAAPTALEDNVTSIVVKPAPAAFKTRRAAKVASSDDGDL
jgi:hypothetical protein